ncbi:MAG: glycosyltransferase family 4 protein [Nitrospirae bacterium]|jgi:glycosyltransferase involved in cell wall biosynthesis|nr:glycosyltransferase family 4 protein [Nitrospirota bacterium]
MFTILHTESSQGWGGQEMRILHESLGMLKRGYRPIIVAPEKADIFIRAQEAGINVFPVYFQKWNPASLLKMRLLIDREKADIVNTHSSTDSWIATVAARISKSGPKIIRTRHLSTPISRSFLSRFIYEILPDALITTGEEIRQMMIENNKFKETKIFSIPTGVDLERFNPAKVKPAFEAAGFSIAMIGVLRSWKGHRFFIEAIPEILERIQDASFYIVGDGPQYENIKNLIRKYLLEDRVFMLGHREDIPEILASLDVIAHPSYGNEGVPQSILQAMAMERPVVASDAGAIKEVVINGVTGFLIEPKNPGQIAEKVIELYKNPGLMAKFKKEARLLIEKGYSLEKMLEKIELLYRQLLSGKNRSCRVRELLE